VIETTDLRLLPEQFFRKTLCSATAYFKLYREFAYSLTPTAITQAVAGPLQNCRRQSVKVRVLALDVVPG